MNFTQKTYKELMSLVENNEAFFFKDFPLDGNVYRIFNYRLASWTLFLEPSALNCRGIMFDVTNQDDVKLVSLPPEKFFNYEEGGVDHTLGKIGDKMEKMDGSLISTYIHNGQLYLKSKGSLFSQQANDAMALLSLEKNTTFKEQMEALALKGFTISLEYTSPENRIVVAYQEEALTVLSMRDHESGKTYYASQLVSFLKENNYDAILEHMVDFSNLLTQDLNQLNFVNEARKEESGEGYVVEIVLENSSYLVKIKNTKYLALHQTKDSVNSPRRLFEAIINEASDDLRSMFADDTYVLNKIEEMENKIQPIFNHIVKTVEDFVEEHKDLPRKDFAILAKKEHPIYMGLMMNGYLLSQYKAGKATDITNPPKENDFKSFAIKHRESLFKIKDEPENVVDMEESNISSKRNMGI